MTLTTRILSDITADNRDIETREFDANAMQGGLDPVGDVGCGTSNVRRALVASFTNAVAENAAAHGELLSQQFEPGSIPWIAARAREEMQMKLEAA